MSDLTLQQRVGHRSVTTIDVKFLPWTHESIVWGGEKRDRMARQVVYMSKEEARRGHEILVADVREHPSAYDLRKKPWYERSSSLASPN